MISILQAGSHPDHPIRYFLEWEFIDGIIYTFGDQIGVQVTMLLFFGITGLALYQSTDSVMVPMGVLIVIAPMTAALLAPIGFKFSIVVMFLAVAIAGTSLVVGINRRVAR